MILDDHEDRRVRWHTEMDSGHQCERWVGIKREFSGTMLKPQLGEHSICLYGMYCTVKLITMEWSISKDQNLRSLLRSSSVTLLSPLTPFSRHSIIHLFWLQIVNATNNKSGEIRCLKGMAALTEQLIRSHKVWPNPHLTTNLVYLEPALDRHHGTSYYEIGDLF